MIFKGHKLTIGLDLGDRFSFYCVLDEAGEIPKCWRYVQRFDYLPDAVARMVKRSGISPRQAYRYLQQAQLLAKPVPVGDLKVAFTAKLSQELVQRLRAFANRTDLSLSEIVSRTLHAALPQRRRHG